MVTFTKAEHGSPSDVGLLQLGYLLPLALVSTEIVGPQQVDMMPRSALRRECKVHEN